VLADGFGEHPSRTSIFDRENRAVRSIDELRDRALYLVNVRR
jgi:hypothetical protein